MHRYLLNISYIGTQFRGLQKPTQIQYEGNPKRSVQGSIELGLKLFKPINEPKLILSSRTDAGVHALQSTVHVDLLRKNEMPYEVCGVTRALNKFFVRENLQIKVNKTEVVPDTFHARFSAKGRTYLYRLAVPKHEKPSEEPEKTTFLANFPIEEIDRCYFVNLHTFDIAKARQVADLLKGKHDFRTFMGQAQQNSKQDHPFFALRHIESITIEPGHSTCTAYSIEKSHEDYNYWNIQISARSFLNRQVRRMVGVIVAVAQNRLSNRDVYEMLTIPSSKSWCFQAEVAPSHGLYLCQVHYDQEDKKFPVELADASTTN